MEKKQGDRFSREHCSPYVNSPLTHMHEHGTISGALIVKEYLAYTTLHATNR